MPPKHDSLDPSPASSGNPDQLLLLRLVRAVKDNDQPSVVRLFAAALVQAWATDASAYQPPAF